MHHRISQDERLVDFVAAVLVDVDVVVVVVVVCVVMILFFCFHLVVRKELGKYFLTGFPRHC